MYLELKIIIRLVRDFPHRMVPYLLADLLVQDQMSISEHSPQVLVLATVLAFYHFLAKIIKTNT